MVNWDRRGHFVERFGELPKGAEEHLRLRTTAVKRIWPCFSSFAAALATAWSRTRGRAILQAFAGVCRLPIQCSFLHFLNDFQSPRLALACSRLSPLDARKGQEKGKLCQVVDS